MDDKVEIKFSDLPEEILLKLFSFLKIQDVVRIGCTCRSLHDLTSQDVVWRRRFRTKCNDHLMSLSLPTSSNHNKYNSTNLCNNNNLLGGIWKKLYMKASFATSFRSRSLDNQGERLCAEFVSNTRGTNGIHFDGNSPKKMSIETWVKVDENKPDGIIVGCQSESARSMRWPQYHWQVLHVGPDRCIRGSIEPYKFLKGPSLDDEWHHVAITASEDEQIMFFDGDLVDSIHFGIGHEYHRHFMKYCQLGNGVISHGVLTPWKDDAMPPGKCGWYPFHGQLREVRIWSGMLPETAVKQNMYCHRVDLLSHDHNCTLIGYWPMNRLVSGSWPWQGSLVSPKTFLRTVVSPLP